MYLLLISIVSRRTYHLVYSNANSIIRFMQCTHVDKKHLVKSNTLFDAVDSCWREATCQNQYFVWYSGLTLTWSTWSLPRWCQSTLCYRPHSLGEGLPCFLNFWCTHRPAGVNSCVSHVLCIARTKKVPSPSCGPWVLKMTAYACQSLLIHKALRSWACISFPDGLRPQHLMRELR